MGQFVMEYLLSEIALQNDPTHVTHALQSLKNFHQNRQNYHLLIQITLPPKRFQATLHYKANVEL